MRVKMHKWFWAWDFDKEERWLNEMSAKGFHLVSVNLCTYLFEEGTPGEYAVRLEMLDNWPTHPESRRYIAFVEESGAEYLDSIVRWAYFRKKVDKGSFDLFSDIDSRIRHLNRILQLVGILAIVELLLFGNILRSTLQLIDVSGQPANLFACIFCGALAALLIYGFSRIAFKRHKLKQSRVLHE